MQGLDDTSWDIMSGTAVKTTKKITLIGSNMTKAEFDYLLLLFEKELYLNGWKKTYSGLSAKSDSTFEANYKL